MSDLKLKTSFDFLMENHTGHVFKVFVKSQNELTWPFLMFLCDFRPKINGRLIIMSI